MLRHIVINRDSFLALLRCARYNGLPTRDEFRANNDLAAEWYWQVFDFSRMGFRSFQEFYGPGASNKCFDFIISTDGFSFTAHFTRPTYGPGEELRPQEVPHLQGDKVFFVDPGRSIAFTAMEGLSGYDFPPPFPAPAPAPVPAPASMIKVSTREYYEMAGFNRFRQKRHLLKMRDYNNEGYITVLKLGWIWCSIWNHKLQLSKQCLLHCFCSGLHFPVVCRGCC
jgi:hypothetical protein